MSNHDYRLFDVDNHYYEPDDVILRHIEPEFREQVPLESVVASTDVGAGREGWVVRPGSLKEYSEREWLRHSRGG